MHKSLLSYMIIGILFVSIIGTLAHFVYDWSGKNMIVGLFTPVNESTWEHIKLLFFPMLIYSLWMNHQLKNEYPCVTSALLSGILAGCILIPIIFYTYTGIIGTNYLILDIATFLFSVIIAFLICYCLTQSCQAKQYEFILRCTVAVMAICFFLFTYFPPSLALFVSP